MNTLLIRSPSLSYSPTAPFSKSCEDGGFSVAGKELWMSEHSLSVLGDCHGFPLPGVPLCRVLSLCYDF